MTEIPKQVKDTTGDDSDVRADFPKAKVIFKKTWQMHSH